MEYEDDILIAEKETDTQMIETPYSEIKQANSENQTIKREYKKFTDYSNEKREKDYEEYEIIQTYTPRKKQQKNTSFNKMINEQNSYIPANETYIYEKTKPQRKTKRTSRIFVSICCAIAVLMGTLGIINSVRINNLMESNMSTTEQIANVGKEITKIDQMIEGIVNEDSIRESAEGQGYQVITSQTEIELNEKNVVEEYKRPTNLFDKICNFISHLFGG